MKLIEYTLNGIMNILDKILCRLDGFRVEEIYKGVIIHLGKNRGRVIIKDEDEKYLGALYG